MPQVIQILIKHKQIKITLTITHMQMIQVMLTVITIDKRILTLTQMQIKI
jgi:hypothetical protein